MGKDKATYFQQTFQQLKKFGFLLESDPKLPSVCTHITGGPLKRSWWSHPMAQVIFQVNEQLADHKDVIISKLVAGKVTFVHRSLWPELLWVGKSREPWQLEGVSNSGRWLLQVIDAHGSLTTNELPQPPGNAKIGVVARELERKLLVNAAQIHTDSGAHAKVLETWAHWADRVGFKGSPIPVANAKKTLEERMIQLNQEFAASARLPWQ